MDTEKFTNFQVGEGFFDDGNIYFLNSRFCKQQFELIWPEFT